MTQFTTQPQVNFKTGKAYPAETAEMLQQIATERNYTNVWGTMKQWNSAGEAVRKNENGTKFSFTNKKGKEVKTVVFNQSQLD